LFEEVIANSTIAGADTFFGCLKTAGKSGLTVKDVAAKLGKSYGNISVWYDFNKVTVNSERSAIVC